MKRSNLSAVALLLVVSVAQAGVKDTKHNFTSAATSPNAYFTGASQVCAFCHTPHNGDNTLVPLGSHVPATGPYNPYDSPTMNMSRTDPNGGSLVCLSCHDGTIGVNALNEVPGPVAAGSYGTPAGAALDGAGKLTSSSSAYVSQDLSDDHPVGIVYDRNQDNDFVDKTGVATSYPDKLLYDGTYVECSSCHDPHDNTYGSFLVEDNSGSALCLRCHVK